jgi:WD40 repeat protein/DNA-binding SARP family transcriptional activator
MQFRVLGAVEVLVGGHPISLGGPKQRTVLATLLVHPNQVVPAEDLIDQVWGEDPPDTARKTLQGYVTHLRRALGPDRLHWRAPGYVLSVVPRELDVAQFEALVRQAKATDASRDRASILYRRALEQWRGPAFADVGSDGAIAAEAHRLEELRLEALEARIAADLDAGRHDEVVPELTALTGERPLRERLWGQLMMALYRSGRQADASAAYHRAREVLADELGMDPSDELRGLHERILRNDPALEAPHERLRGYELVEEIGEGGFGIVHRAWQPQLAREVAIKAIRPALANDPEFIRRFEAEAQLVARLEHANIVPLYDYWREPGAAYLVLRWIRGGSLDETRPPFDLETIVRFEEQIASALSFAHRLGVVHSDLKPANVLLDEEGNAYLSDFGIAADLRGLRSEERDLRLSPAYLSPEQIRGEPPTPATDIYSLGLLLYQLLCGAHPFSGTPPMALLQKQLHEPIPPITERRPELPRAIDDVIARATAKDPGARFSDVAAFGIAFRKALQLVPATIALKSEVELVNPYKGLRPFGEADALDFFGRHALIDRLVARLRDTVEGSRFLGIVGPSGSGKSSAVHAGLIPALRAGAVYGATRWFVVEMVPGDHPFEELEVALLRIASDPPSTLVDRFRGDRGLADAAEQVLPPDGSELFLVIDQLEELFTHVEDEETRAWFLASLATAATDPRSRVRVLVTLRADYFDRPLAYPGFGPLLGSRTEAVTPLTPAELELAISGPAERIGLDVEPELLAEIVADSTGRLGALPLLQYALTELFERRQDGALTVSAYREVGGVGGALAGRAEHLFEATGGDGGRESTRQLFLRLVNVDEGVEDLRRRVRRSELDSIEGDREAMTAAIDAFTRHRLLTSDRDPVTREPTVEVAHEALLRAWPRLRGWIDGSREDLLNHRRLATEAAQWEDAARDPSFLLRASRLERLEAWAASSSFALSSAEREYLETSVREREAEQAAEEARRRRERFLERRSMKRLRALVAVLAAAALVAMSLTVVARNQRNRAEHESLIATARELAAAAVANLHVDVERSLLLALEAVQTTYRADGTVLIEAEEVLHRAVQAHRLVFTVPGYRGEFSADGSRLLVAGPQPGEADVYQTATGERISTAIASGSGSQGGSGDRLGLVFSADGRLFATWGGDTQDIRLFETATGEEVQRLSVPQGALYDPAFSPDGRFLAVGGPASGWTGDPACCPQTYLFDLRAGALLNIQFAIGPITFSPDGKRSLIADSWHDPSLEAWVAGYIHDVRQRGASTVDARVPVYHFPGQEADVPIYEGVVGTNLTRGQTLLGHEGDVLGAAWSPDGERVVTLSPQRVVVWDVSMPKAYEPYTYKDPSNLLLPDSAVSPPAGLFTAVAFGPESRIATGMSDGTTIVWKLSAGGAEPILTLAGHDAAVGTVDFSPDGTRLTTSSDDGRVRVWDITLAGGHERLTLAGAGGLAYSPDGALLAVGSEDGDVHLYEAAGGGERLVLEGHEGRVNAIAFDPSGTTLATAGFVDGTARIWDAASGGVVARVQLARPSTYAGGRCPLYRTSLTQAFDVAFSPDGTMLATGGWEGASSTIIWDPATGERQRVLAQDPEQGQWGRSVDFSPDGRLVAGEGWDDVFVWSVEDAAIVARMREEQVTTLAFSPDGRHLATGSLDGSLKVWDARTGRQLDSLTGNLGQVLDLAFSPDGVSLATSSSDGTVRLWDVGTGRQTVTLASGVAGEVGAESKFCFRTLKVAHLGVGGKLAFSPDGTQLAYTAADGTVRVLALDIDDLIDLARSRLTRSWTRDECETYLHRETCPARP